MQWQKVSESAPVDNELVLIYVDAYPSHYIAYRNSDHCDNKDGIVGDRFFTDNGEVFDTEYVIAWMQLPEEPKELMPDWQAIWEARRKKNDQF